ncbi:hypothetical protein N0V90_005686 [Kalmusia sp. IMI 367209]|nr:hypothetical protein N0V90_005686 [Kalmusia sp. IMI 367209]
MAPVYDPSTYDNLPLLAEAGQMLEAKHGKDIIPQFHALFEKYETKRVFGVVLNHRHFDMSPDERLVEYAGTWFVSEDNKCRPYEFHYSPDDDVNEEDSSPDNPKYSAFIDSFNALLREKNALGLFWHLSVPR